MSRQSDYPVSVPVITNLLLDQVKQAAQDEGRRPKAFPTRFRYSSAGKCGRALAYEAEGGPESDEGDVADEWVMWLGKAIHEVMGSALQESYGSAVTLEAPSTIGDLVSGSADAVIKTDQATIVYELKTTGAMGFDRAIGLRRIKYQRNSPEGPRMTAKLQGALNAVAHEADMLVIGVIGLEAISKPLARATGFGMHDRVMGEWHYNRGEFEAWATLELARLRGIAMVMDEGILPPRAAVGDEGETVILNPDAAKVHWMCEYCRFRTRCSEDGL